MMVLAPPPPSGPEPAVRPCRVCERSLPGGGARCPNPLCASAARWFGWNIAAAERSGPLEVALNAFKYRGSREWAPIFGGMLVELMERRRRLLQPFDLITASPTFLGTGGRDVDHTRLMLVEAARQVPREHAWPFDLGRVPAIVKTRPTPRLAWLDHRERRRVAEEQLRPALHVPDRTRTAGRRILVVDDVFTDGRTLDEVARALRLRGGARQVCGLALCRQPWRGHAATIAAALPSPAVSADFARPLDGPGPHPPS
ncbi:MAG: phosphoribosyltransferase family protein [Candidatus Dormibacteria bacterium]